MSLVLVVARPPRLAVGVTAPVPVRSGTTEARNEVWSAVRHEVAQLRSVPATAVTHSRLDLLAGAIAEDGDDPSVTYAATSDEAAAAVGRAIDEGANAIAVLPIALAIEDAEGSLAGAGDLERLRARLDAIGGANPGVEILYIGPPFDDPPALEAVIAALRPAGSEEPALLAGAIERAFDRDLERFGRFVTALQAGAPAGTRIILRGSAVQGVSYRSGEPFDGRGPGTSDLDVVLVGEDAMAEWEPEAFYIPGVNSQPLWDEATDLAAPRLEAARIAAQRIAQRPVSLQAMARWFLDLRSGLQGTPYVVLAG